VCDPVYTIYSDRIQLSSRQHEEIQILAEMKVKRKLNVSDYITYGNLSHNRTRNIKYIIFIVTFKEVFKIISIFPYVWDPILLTNVFQQKLKYYFTIAK
jgi:hypothetical protein